MKYALVIYMNVKHLRNLQFNIVRYELITIYKYYLKSMVTKG